MIKKRVIILQHGGGELANQLWNFISIYAYCLEKGHECRNYSFFEYGNFFNITVGNKFINFLFFTPFRSYTKRRHGLRVRVFRFIYKFLYVRPVAFLFKQHVITSQNALGEAYCLPPTKTTQGLRLQEKKDGALYMIGWLFRNPKGIIKYRENIIQYFKPKQKILKSIDKTISPLRLQYKHIVGIHIRQGDYVTHKSGEYFIDQKRVREIIDEYLQQNDIILSDIYFIITTDGPVDENYFKGLHYSLNRKNAVEDLFTLSKCDVIIGSDSSFGNFASYYGNIPHIVFKKKDMDWNYYQDKKEYFENKYSVMESTYKKT